MQLYLCSNRDGSPTEMSKYLGFLGFSVRILKTGHVFSKDNTVLVNRFVSRRYGFTNELCISRCLHQRSACDEVEKAVVGILPAGSNQCPQIAFHTATQCVEHLYSFSIESHWFHTIAVESCNFFGRLELSEK